MEVIGPATGELADPFARTTERIPAVTATSYVPEVDALRGLAMSAVIALHCDLLPFGWMGVWLFFVVSGFAVTTSLMSSQRRSPSKWATIWHFYVRRAMRIWPLYFTFVAFNAVIIILLGNYGPLSDLPWLLTFTYNIRMICKTYTPGSEWFGFGHLWTLSVEQQFYLVFPFLILLNKDAQKRALLGVIIIAPFIRAAVAVWAAARGWEPISIAFAVYAFAPAHFDAFAAGALIALLREDIARNKRLAYLSMAVAAVVAFGHVAFYLAIGIVQAGHFSLEAMRNIVSGIAYGQGREISVYFLPTCFASAMLVGILAEERICLWLCRLPGLQAMGRVSYGGYLLHVFALMSVGLGIQWAVGPQTGVAAFLCHLTLFGLGLPLTLAMAWLSFTYYEQLFLRARKNYR